METNYDKYRKIFFEPNTDDMKLKNNLICLRDFEYYENESYNPIFMRALGNSIYAINSIYEDFKNDIEKLEPIFSHMPFGFGKIVKDDTENIVLYTISNEEHFYKSLNNEDFLNDLENELKGKKQTDFSFRKEGNNFDESYLGIIYGENAMFNIKNIIKSDYEELPNLIFYINSQKIETIDKLSKIFNFELINDEITNANIQIQPKVPNWSGIRNVAEENRIIINKKYYGYNELDFVFLNKKEKIIESNKMYCNILEKDSNIILKKNYAYFVEIKLSFPNDPEKEIKHLFIKAKNLYSLYKRKYNLEYLGIILVYDSIESIGNSFCNNVNINFSKENIDLQIIYLHVAIQVSNMNYLINKISKMEDKLSKMENRFKEKETELTGTTTELTEIKKRLDNLENFQKKLVSKLIHIFPDKKEVLLSLEDDMKNLLNQSNKKNLEDLDNINSKSPKAVENKNENTINVIVPMDAQIPVENEDGNSIKINEKNNGSKNIKNKNYLNIDENEKENAKDKANNFEIQNLNSFKVNCTNLIIENKIDILNDNFNHNIINNAHNFEETPEKINFNVIAGRFKKRVMDFTEHNFNRDEIKENIKNSLNIFKELNEEITKFNELSKTAYLKKDTDLKKFLSNSLFSENTHFLEGIYKILEDIINSKNGTISKEFMKLKNVLFGYKINYSSLFYKEKGPAKSFIKQYIYNIIFLLEKESPENIDLYYSSLLKIIIEFISKIESKQKDFFRFVKFCLLVYKKTNYSIDHFISNFIEGMNTDNEAFLVEKQNPELKNYLGFIKSQAK